VDHRHARDVDGRRSPVRRALGRRRNRWILTAGVAVMAVVWTVSTVARAESEAHAWGTRRAVAVARHDLVPGDVVTDESIEWAPRPEAVLPADVAPHPAGRVVTHAIAAGEVLIERRLSGGGATGPAALLEPDALAFAVPVDPSTPALAVGELVDAFAPGDPVGSGVARSSSATATRIASGATVVSVTETRVMIAVDAVQAPALARALLDSSVVLALSG
jgi:hypothetical protein